MNILEAYILQKKYLTIVLSCLDISVLKEIGTNLSKDLDFTLIDLTDKINDISSLDEIDISNINELDTNDSKKIIISSIFPDNFFKFRINFHINISLSKNLIEEKSINMNLVNLNSNIVKSSRINKFINLHKFNNNKDIEDNIFQILMEFITKKLDNGSYSQRIQNLQDKSDPLHEIEHNKKNDKIDNDIMEDIELNSIDPIKDINVQEISVEDVDMDDEFIPTKPFQDENLFMDTHEVRQYGGFSSNEIVDDLTLSISKYLYNKILNDIKK